MGTYPKVSIIIPVYNVEPYLERCLHSVMSQTYRNSLECLIVDDCGTDRSMDVVERIVDAYHGPIRFKIIHHEHNRGVSAARNTGMEAATGDYLFFLDSDDEISVDCIEKLTSPLTEEQYDLVVGNTLTIGSEKVGKWQTLKLNDGEVLKEKKIMDTFFWKWSETAWNKLYRADFVSRYHLKFMEGLIYEDELWGFQVACMAKSLIAVNQLTYIYYIRNNSITTSLDAKSKRQEALKIIVEEMRNFLIDRNICSASAYRLVQYFFWRILKPVQNNRSQFIQDYCQLRHVTHFPLAYRIKAVGPHLRPQIHNLYYLMPSKFAARIIFAVNFNEKIHNGNAI